MFFVCLNSSRYFSLGGIKVITMPELLNKNHDPAFFDFENDLTTGFSSGFFLKTKMWFLLFLSIFQFCKT